MKKTELEQVIDSLSNMIESQDFESEDEVKVSSRYEIIKRINALEKEFKQSYQDDFERNILRKKLNYWYKLADEWRE